MKLLGNLQQGLLFVLSAPAGTGKTTLVEMLEEEFFCIEKNVTYTTREKRPGEIEGKSYYFISKEEFEKKIEGGAFLEYEKVFDHYYGIEEKKISDQLKQNKHVILVIDTQGVKTLLTKNIPFISIFISPPSAEELERRLKKRKTETEKQRQKRLQWSYKELEMIPFYDYHIINDDLQMAYNILRSILIAEEHKTKRIGDYVIRKTNDQ
jgi:guanylate kinase